MKFQFLSAILEINTSIQLNGTLTSLPIQNQRHAHSNHVRFITQIVKLNLNHLSWLCPKHHHSSLLLKILSLKDGLNLFVLSVKIVNKRLNHIMLRLFNRINVLIHSKRRLLCQLRFWNFNMRDNKDYRERLEMDSKISLPFQSLHYHHFARSKVINPANLCKMIALSPMLDPTFKFQTHHHTLSLLTQLPSKASAQSSASLVQLIKS